MAVIISTAAINSYTAGNSFILGLITSAETVGYFSAADKVVKALQGLFGPISQSLYPHINMLAAESKEKALLFIRKSLAWVGSTSLFLSFILWISAAWIVSIILGPKFDASVTPVRWMAFIPFLVGVNNILGIQTMLTFGMQRSFSRIIVLSAVVNFTLYCHYPTLRVLRVLHKRF